MQVGRNRELGLGLGPRVNTLWSWLLTLTITIFSIRGVIVLNSGLSANTVYVTTAIISIILSTYGFIICNRFKNHELLLLKQLLIVNGLLTFINVVVDLFLGVSFNPTILYFSLGPYIIFLFLRVPTFYLKVVVCLITIAISYSVCENFFYTLQGPDGVEKVFEYNLKLRPEVFKAFSRSGEFLRVSGYTGNYHDSANILGMACPFFFISFLLKKKMFDLGMFVFAMISIFFTQSAANIMIVIATTTFFSGYLLIRNRKLSTYLFFLFGLFIIIFITIYFSEFTGIFLSRIGRGGDWEGMLNQLDISSLYFAIPFMLVGHGEGFGSESITTEIALMKGLFQWGIVHAGILYMILLYPVIRFVKIRAICSDALPSLSAILFGFMSLLHYGSLLRITSVFLFFTFHAICLNKLIYCRNANLALHSVDTY